MVLDARRRTKLQYKRVPGRPDIAFPGHRKVIWVHGCFWHGHPGCPKGTLPKSRQDFWVPKLEGNRSRDIAVQAEAQRLGWQTLVVWECELSWQDGLTDRLSRFLESGHWLPCRAPYMPPIPSPPLLQRESATRRRPGLLRVKCPGHAQERFDFGLERLLNRGLGRTIASYRSGLRVYAVEVSRNYPYQAAWTQVTHHPRREPS